MQMQLYSYVAHSKMQNSARSHFSRELSLRNAMWSLINNLELNGDENLEGELPLDLSIRNDIWRLKELLNENPVSRTVGQL